MKHYFFILVCFFVIQACSTKEELAPNLTEIPEEVVPIPPYLNLKDSPMCVISRKNYITFNTTKPLNIDYGITGNLDISSSILYDDLEYYRNYIDANDKNGNGRIIVSLGDNYLVETGIYITADNPYNDLREGKRYLSILLKNYDPWGSSSFTSLGVKSGEKVLVVVDNNRTKARIKFCNAALDFENIINSGSISGEIEVAVK